MTSLTSQQQQQYERALASVRRDALDVRAHGTRKSDGAAIYCVPSRSQPDLWHIVVVNGLHLTCDCQAAKYGKYCCHRALVHARLSLETSVRRDAHGREIERALHEAARALHIHLEAPAVQRSPKPRDDDKSVSIFR